MYRTLVLSLLGLWLTLCVTAQTVYRLDSSYYPNQPIPELAVHWVASQNLGHFPAHMLAFEHRLAGRINLEHAIGLIYDRNVFEDDDIYFERKKGFKSGMKVKFYDQTDRPFQPFYGLEAFFNHRTYERTRTFELSCGTDCAYFQQRTYEIENNTLGLRLNAGLVSPLTDHLYIEMEVAMGVRHSNLTSTGKPSDFLTQYGRLHAEDETITNYAINLNIKLAYRIK